MFDKGLHIGRKRRANADDAAGMRMRKGDCRGVQGLSVDESTQAAVQVVAPKRVSQMRQVDADLMGAPRRQSDLQERGVVSNGNAKNARYNKLFPSIKTNVCAIVPPP